MPIDLLNYEQRTRKAVRAFWATRQTAHRNQVDRGHADLGERAGVTAGKNIDGFVALAEDLVRANGLPHANIHRARRVVTLPGFFLLRLVATIKLKEATASEIFR